MLGCQPQGGTRVPDQRRGPALDDAVAKSEDPAALAKRIDPGPVDGLGAGMPSWVAQKFDLARNRASPADIDALVERWRTIPATASTDQRFQLLVEIGFAVIGLEGQGPDTVKDAQALATLGATYGTFDIPGLSDPGGLFAPTLMAVANAMARAPDGSLDEAQAAQVLQWLSAALGRLPSLHRRIAARMLVEQPDHAELPSILERVAASTIGDPHLAVDLRRRAMVQRGRYAKAMHHRELAYACYSVLDIECGDTELAAARASKDPPEDGDAARMTAVEGQRDKAARAIALEGATSVEERIERARLLSELGDRPGALAAFEAITKDHPNDARAITGAIAVRLSSSFDVDGAYAALLASDGKPLEHRDRAYYEVSVGVRAMAIGKSVIPELIRTGDTARIIDGLLPALAPVRRGADELAKLGVEKGEVLAFLFAIGDELIEPGRKGDLDAMVKIAQGLLPRVVELRRKLPKSPYAYDVMLAAVQFSPDRAAVLDAIAAPVPVGDDAALAMRAAMTRLTLALQFEDRATLDAVTKQIEAWPESFGAAARSRALARVDAVSWRLFGDPALRDRSMRRYDAVLTSQASANDLTDVVNYAALLVDAGKPDEAALVLQRARAIDDSAAQVSLLAATLGPTPDLAALERLAGDSEHQVAIAALMWLAASDTDKAKRRAWAQQLAAKRKESSLRGGTLPGNPGLGASSSLNVNVGYSARNGLELIVDAGPVPRVYTRPPKAKAAAAAKPSGVRVAQLDLRSRASCPRERCTRRPDPRVARRSRSADASPRDHDRARA